MLRLRSLLVLILALCPLGAGAAPSAVSGQAYVIDGDTVDIAGTRIRLIGIDAPEMGQTCERGGRSWACGAWAKGQLHARLAGQKVVCTGRDHDRYGRLLATCQTKAGDVGRGLVRDGVAFAYRQYSTAYLPEEQTAARLRVGIWAGTATRPDTVRHAAADIAPAPSGPSHCVIKGNISAHGHIYHQPGQHDYAATRISTSKGERWFCSAQEAEAAGWRAARW